jgi:C1A family cysteine protease
MDRKLNGYKLGWFPDLPDLRDYTPERQPVVAQLLKTNAVKKKEPLQLSESTDLRQWCSPVEDQGNLGSCTANAAVALVEYFERRAFGKHIDASRLFLYKATRNILHLTGDSGASMRATMGALVLFGVPPEEYWPYETTNQDEEPPAFCYAFAQNYRTMNYFRLDPPGIRAQELLAQIKNYLIKGFPVMFGLTVYDSFSQAEKDGKIPFPAPIEKVMGGHALVAVGYNDKITIKNSQANIETTGAFLIRNSWGAQWGDEGYGWLPYEYILQGLAIDWWTLVKNDWVDTGMFDS